MAAVTLTGVNKTYPNGFEAISALDLEIHDGEFLVLVGPSGCGKSTVLRMIAGLEEISGGELRIGDEVVNEIHPRARDIAMVFQNYALYPHKTVAENIGISLKLAKKPKAEIAAEVERVAAVLDLTQYLNRKPGKLSGGQRQRVAMGRAIVRKPKAFLMDEPLSNLDAKLRVQMRAEIAKIQRDLAATTVFVTHDQVEAMTMGDRVAVLRDGHLQQVDTPQRLYDRPTNVFVAGFIGSPSMNMMIAGVTIDAAAHEQPADDPIRLDIGPATIAVTPDIVAQCPRLRDRAGRRVVVGVRPEDITTAANADEAHVVGRVTLVESLGSELLAHFDIEGTTPYRPTIVPVDDAEFHPTLSGYTARLEPTVRLRASDVVPLRFDLANAHFFDVDTGDTVI